MSSWRPLALKDGTIPLHEMHYALPFAFEHSLHVQSMKPISTFGVDATHGFDAYEALSIARSSSDEAEGSQHQFGKNMEASFGYR